MKKNRKLSIDQIFWYFLIFSVLGLVIETLYCYFTMGIWESRKGFIWGPFCPVYGVGATILMMVLSQVKGGNIKIFLYGGLLGDIAEYLMSYVLEAFYGIRFWEYSYTSFNLNGRICVIYTVFWGILSLILMKIVKPWIDAQISKIPQKINTVLVISISCFLIIDFFATIWAVTSFEERIYCQYYGIEKTSQTRIQEIKYQLEERLFPNEKMVKTFPNLRFIDEKGTEYYIKDILNKKD